MRTFSIAILFNLLAATGAFAAPPRLVVNIVVSQMRYDYLARFAANMGDGGFLRLRSEGMSFSDARYNFMQTTTPATLGTITTGADPSMHGVVSERWTDYTGNRAVELIADPAVRGLDCDAGIGEHSPVNITVPTLGDRLRQESPASKVVSIASSAVSAIVMGGTGEGASVYWMDETRGNWISSTAYMDRLPEWVRTYNGMRIASQWLDYRWSLLRGRDSYINHDYSVIDFTADSRFRRAASFDFMRRRGISRDYQGILYTPAGNSMVAEFARQAIVNERLGADEATDLLNICFDTPRHIGSAFGSESLEVEDMLYRLDEELADLLTFIGAQMGGMDKVVVVLTSDHGASDSHDYAGDDDERLFNASQFKVIVDGFMNAQWGPGNWVLDYSDRQLYLNRNQIYMKGLSLEEVQNRVAAFALQFRGVSHVLTSTAMQMSYFSGSYAEKMQNSFYPRRSGDVMINLMPGWIEQADDRRAGSGSMYEYDTHVPLMIMGHRLYGQQVARTVNMKDLAPTLARIMEIGRPIAAEGEPLEEVTRLY